MKLKTTGQKVYTLRWTATAIKPWSNNHERVIIPNTNQFHKNHVQIVRKSSLVEDSYMG